jgi:hypothetical protein
MCHLIVQQTLTRLQQPAWALAPVKAMITALASLIPMGVAGARLAEVAGGTESRCCVATRVLARDFVRKEVPHLPLSSILSARFERFIFSIREGRLPVWISSSMP